MTTNDKPVSIVKKTRRQIAAALLGSAKSERKTLANRRNAKKPRPGRRKKAGA